jgi:hypothetical protein
LHLNTRMFKPLSKSLVIGVRDGQELNSSVRERLDCLDDIVSVEGNVLDSSTSVVFNILLDLRFSLAIGGLIDGHLDVLVEISDDNRSK